MNRFREKREAKRVPVSMKVHRGEEDRAIGFGYAQDISEKGMAIDARALIVAEELPEIGEKIQLRFKLPGGRLFISLVGEVLRVDPTNPPRLALGFGSLDPDFRAEIQNYVARSE